MSFDELRTGGCAATPFDRLRVTRDGELYSDQADAAMRSTKLGLT
jgi:hypothetical protein